MRQGLGRVGGVIQCIGDQIGRRIQRRRAVGSCLGIDAAAAGCPSICAGQPSRVIACSLAHVHVALVQCDGGTGSTARAYARLDQLDALRIRAEGRGVVHAHGTDQRIGGAYGRGDAIADRHIEFGLHCATHRHLIGMRREDQGLNQALGGGRREPGHRIGAVMMVRQRACAIGQRSQGTIDLAAVGRTVGQFLGEGEAQRASRIHIADTGAGEGMDRDIVTDVLGSCSSQRRRIVGPGERHRDHLGGAIETLGRETVAHVAALWQSLNRCLAVARRVGPVAAGVQCEGAVGTRSTPLGDEARFAIVDVGHRQGSAGNQIIQSHPDVFREAAGGGAPDHGWRIDAMYGDGFALRHQAAMTVTDVIVHHDGGMLGGCQVHVGGIGRIDRQTSAVERHACGQGRTAAGGRHAVHGISDVGDSQQGRVAGIHVTGTRKQVVADGGRALIHGIAQRARNRRGIVRAGDIEYRSDAAGGRGAIRDLYGKGIVGALALGQSLGGAHAVAQGIAHDAGGRIQGRRAVGARVRIGRGATYLGPARQHVACGIPRIHVGLGKGDAGTGRAGRGIRHATGFHQLDALRSCGNGGCIVGADQIDGEGLAVRQLPVAGGDSEGNTRCVRSRQRIDRHRVRHEYVLARGALHIQGTVGGIRLGNVVDHAIHGSGPARNAGIYSIGNEGAFRISRGEGATHMAAGGDQAGSRIRSRGIVDGDRGGCREGRRLVDGDDGASGGTGDGFRVAAIVRVGHDDANLVVRILGGERMGGSVGSVGDVRPTPAGVGLPGIVESHAGESVGIADARHAGAEDLALGLSAAECGQAHGSVIDVVDHVGSAVDRLHGAAAVGIGSHGADVTAHLGLGCGEGGIGGAGDVDPTGGAIGGHLPLVGDAGGSAACTQVVVGVGDVVAGGQGSVLGHVAGIDRARDENVAYWSVIDVGDAHLDGIGRGREAGASRVGGGGAHDAEGGGVVGAAGAVKVGEWIPDQGLRVAVKQGIAGIVDIDDGVRPGRSEEHLDVVVKRGARAIEQLQSRSAPVAEVPTTE